MTDNESYEIRKEQCPACAANGKDTSGDNLSVYSDGHSYCHACEYYDGGPMAKDDTPEPSSNFLSGKCVSLDKRGIREDTCKKYRYEVAQDKYGEWWQVANYYVDGKRVAQHIRNADKKFLWEGNSNGVELFGQHLWRDTNGKRIIITEGEIDAMSVAQVMGLTWPVVSLPSGSGSVDKAIKANLEFLLQYEEIVLCFDMDEAGQKATEKACSILPPGRVKVVSLPMKDANEMLTNGKSKELKTALWEAQTYSPDEILHIGQVIDSSMTSWEDMQVWPFPFDELSEFCIGQRSGEITLYCSGTGSGKSTFLRELAYDHADNGRKVGLIMLEESPQETMEDLISIDLNKPVRAIHAGRMMNDLRAKMGKQPIVMDIIDDLTDAEYAASQRKLRTAGLYIYDHLGQNAMSKLLNRMEYMAVSLGVDVIILDHITAAAAGLMGVNSKDFEGGASERLIIDNMMKDLRGLAVRTGVHIDIVSQLKKTDKAYEEGARITIQDLRGSGALASVPNTVIALERNRQADDPIEANTTVVRVLKNRLTGKSGVATHLYYDETTNRMTEQRGVDFG